MPKFRKRPVEIEAWEWNGASRPSERPAWLNSAGAYLTHDGVLIIPTLEGDMAASPGDWIIRGVKGEVYPCKPNIFAATYDPVNPAPADMKGA